MVVTLSHSRLHQAQSRSTRVPRSSAAAARARSGMETREEDFVAPSRRRLDPRLSCSSSPTCGRLHWLKVHELPQLGRAAKGKVDRRTCCTMHRRGSSSRRCSRCGASRTRRASYIILCTRKGTIKKTELAAFANPRKAWASSPSTSIEGDELIAAVRTTGAQRRRSPRHAGAESRSASDEHGRPADGPQRDRRARHRR